LKLLIVVHVARAGLDRLARRGALLSSLLQWVRPG
jgi:hypothetical protein